MTKENGKNLLDKIVSELDEMTSEMSNRESIVTIGGHEISRRLLYAGGSQWIGCGRDWDSTKSGWGWVVDGQYRLTAPDLFGFDGHNMISRQTGYYLQDGYDPQITPNHDGRDGLDRVPGRILLDIGRGLADAKSEAANAAAKEDVAAAEILSKLES